MSENTKKTEVLYLPVETSRGIEYAVIPRNMSYETFDFMVKCLDFYAAHCPGFIIKPEPEPELPPPPTETL